MKPEKHRKTYKKAIAFIANITNEIMAGRRNTRTQSKSRGRKKPQEPAKKDLTSDNAESLSMQEWVESIGIKVGTDLSKYPYRIVSIPIRRLTAEEIESALNPYSAHQAASDETIIFSDDVAELTMCAPQTENCAADSENDDSDQNMAADDQFSNESDVELAPAAKRRKLSTNVDSAQPMVGEEFYSNVSALTEYAHEEMDESVVYEECVDDDSSVESADEPNNIEDIAEVWLAVPDDLRDLPKKHSRDANYSHENVHANYSTNQTLQIGDSPALENNQQVAENDIDSDDEEQQLVCWDEDDMASENGSIPPPASANVVNPNVNEDSNSTIQTRAKFIARHRSTVESTQSSVSRGNHGQNVSQSDEPCAQEENMVSLISLMLKARLRCKQIDSISGATNLKKNLLFLYSRTLHQQLV